MNAKGGPHGLICRLGRGGAHDDHVVVLDRNLVRHDVFALEHDVVQNPGKVLVVRRQAGHVDVLELFLQQRAEDVAKIEERSRLELWAALIVQK